MNEETDKRKSESIAPVSSSDLLACALRGLIKLLEDQDIVRNIEHDADFMAFTRQGIRITNALRAAHDALDTEALANDKLSDRRANNP